MLFYDTLEDGVYALGVGLNVAGHFDFGIEPKNVALLLVGP